MQGTIHTPAADRMQLLDSIRLLAAVGVIVSHVTTELYPHSPLWAVGSFSVPFYLFVALYLTVRGFKKDPERAVVPYLLGRILKLYLPFLVWNVAYELMHLVKYPGARMTSPSLLLWAATYAHLYFLPLLLIATLVVTLLVRPIIASAAFRVLLSILMVAAAAYCTWFMKLTPLADDPMPAEQTIYHIERTLPSTFLAIVFAIWAGTRERAFRVSPKAAMLGVALMLAALSFQIAQRPEPILRSLSGFGLVLIAFTPAWFAILKPAATIGRNSYGIYLSHVAFIRIGMTLAQHFGIPRDLELAFAVGVFALICSTLLSMTLAHSKWTSWIVGCDVGDSKPQKKPRPPVTLSPLQTARLQTQDRLENVPH